MDASLNPKPNQTRILVVDDDHFLADTLVILFTHSGYDARAVYSAEQAVLIAESFCPDILLTDVMMGEMSGVDLAMHFKDRRPGCKVLLSTGDVGASVLVERAAARGHRFFVLSKSTYPTDLLRILSDFS